MGGGWSLRLFDFLFYRVTPAFRTVLCTVHPYTWKRLPSAAYVPLVTPFRSALPLLPASREEAPAPLLYHHTPHLSPLCAVGHHQHGSSSQWQQQPWKGVFPHIVPQPTHCHRIAHPHRHRHSELHWMATVNGGRQPPRPIPPRCTAPHRRRLRLSLPHRARRREKWTGWGRRAPRLRVRGSHTKRCVAKKPKRQTGAPPPNTTERSCASDNREARVCGLGAKRSCQGPPERGLTECRPHGVRVRGLKLVPGKPARGLTECRNGWSLKLGQTVGRTGRQRGVCSPKYT